MRWANRHLLFWWSRVPLVTGWAGATRFAGSPVAADRAVRWCEAVAGFPRVRALLARPRRSPVLASGPGRDFKGRISVVLCMVAVSAALRDPWIPVGLSFWWR